MEEDAHDRTRGDQALQAMLLDYGLLEDWDPRLLDEWGETGEASSFAGSGTLRQLRRTGRLGELSETAQSTLLGSTLFQYSGDALPSRAPAPRMMQSTMGSSAGFGGTQQAYMTLRRRVEQLLRDSSFGGTTGRDGDFSQSLTSTMLGGLRGVGASAPDFSSTMGVLEGHLSPLEETLASSSGFDASQPFEGLRETARSGFGSTGGASGLSGASSERPGSRDSGDGSFLGETRDSDGFLPTRNPALATTDSWALGDSRSFAGQTGRSALGSLADMGEEDRTDVLVRLINSASFGDFDESLVRSVQRVLQLGSLLAGERLSKVEVENLPKVHFEQQEEQQCSICLEAFRHGELLTQLPCGHFFRVDCIARWFQSSSQCPLCRSECA